MRYLPLLFLAMLAGCSSATSVEPSLAPRTAEAIDPRLPIDEAAVAGSVSPELASQLAVLTGAVRAAVPTFEARRSEAHRLAVGAGPVASESWIAAEQALSRLIQQYGVTSEAAAEIDALAASRLDANRWIAPADRLAIAAAASDVAAISRLQTEAIDQVRNEIAR